MLKGMAAGNLLLASAILLSGATYTKIASLSEILNWNIFSEKTFYNIQNMYLFPELMRLGRRNKILFSVSLKLKTCGCLEMVDVTVPDTVLNMGHTP